MLLFYFGYYLSFDFSTSPLSTLFCSLSLPYVIPILIESTDDVVFVLSDRSKRMKFISSSKLNSNNQKRKSFFFFYCFTFQNLFSLKYYNKFSIFFSFCFVFIFTFKWKSATNCLMENFKFEPNVRINSCYILFIIIVALYLSL